MQIVKKKAEKIPVGKSVHPVKTSEYLEVRIEIAGSHKYQKVGGTVGFRTQDARLLPMSENKEEIKRAIQDLFSAVLESMDPVVNTVVDTVEALADEFARREG